MCAAPTNAERTAGTAAGIRRRKSGCLDRRDRFAAGRVQTEADAETAVGSIAVGSDLDESGVRTGEVRDVDVVVGLAPLHGGDGNGNGGRHGEP